MKNTVLLKLCLFVGLSFSFDAFGNDAEIYCSALEEQYLQDPTFGGNESRSVNFESCQYGRKIKCVNVADILLSSYEKIMVTYIDSTVASPAPLLIGTKKKHEAYDLNLKKNVQALVDLHQSALNEIKTFLDTTLKDIGSPMTHAELIESYGKIHLNMKKAEDKLLEVTEEDNKLIYAMSLNADEIARLLGKSVVVLKDDACDQEVKDAVKKVIAHAEDLVSELSGIKSYINVAKQKRTILLEKIREALVVTSQQRLSSNLGKSLEEIREEISVVFELEKLTYEISSWWLDINRDGLANRLHTTYFQHDEPLRILRSHLGEIDIFKGKAVAIRQKTEAAGDFLLEDLEKKKAMIDSNIQAILSRGWEGAFKQQQTYLNLISTNVADYTQQCQSLLSKYQELSKDIKSQEDFLPVETLFRTIFDQCQKRNK